MRTKTSGPGKAIKTLQLYVATDAWVQAPEWLEVGWNIWEELSKEAGLSERDFLLPVPGPSLETLTRKVASYTDAAALSKALLSGLVAGHDRGRLLLPGLPTFWTEHSERVTLRSWASAASRGWRSNVWGAAERADVEKAQVKIARFTKASKGKADPVDEEALLSKVRARLVEQGVEPSVVGEQLSLLWFFGSSLAMPATPGVDSQESASERFSDGSDSDVAAPAEEVQSWFRKNPCVPSFSSVLSVVRGDEPCKGLGSATGSQVCVRGSTATSVIPGRPRATTTGHVGLVFPSSVRAAWEVSSSDLKSGE